MFWLIFLQERTSIETFVNNFLYITGDIYEFHIKFNAAIKYDYRDCIDKISRESKHVYRYYKTFASRTVYFIRITEKFEQSIIYYVNKPGYLTLTCSRQYTPCTFAVKNIIPAHMFRLVKTILSRHGIEIKLQAISYNSHSLAVASFIRTESSQFLVEFKCRVSRAPV